MKLICTISLLLLFSVTSFANDTHQINAVKTIIEAVNTKKPELYVSVFAENTQIYLDNALKIDGKEALLKNRTKHLNNHSKAKSEIQHLVEIDNKVIMHDKVWLDIENDEAQDIVEIFTFENGQITRVDVIQPNDLFTKNKK